MGRIVSCTECEGATPSPTVAPPPPTPAPTEGGGLIYLFTATIGSYNCGSDIGSIAVYGDPFTPQYFTVGYTYYQSDGQYLNWNGSNTYPWYTDEDPSTYTITTYGTVWNGGGFCGAQD